MSYDTSPPDRSVKVAHLVFGLFFLGLVGIWTLVQTDVVTGDRLAVLGPGVLIAAGVIGLVASLANSRRSTRRDRELHDATTVRTDDTDHTDPTQEY